LCALSINKNNSRQKIRMKRTVHKKKFFNFKNTIYINRIKILSLTSNYYVFPPVFCAPLLVTCTVFSSIFASNVALLCLQDNIIEVTFFKGFHLLCCQYKIQTEHNTYRNKVKIKLLFLFFLLYSLI
jgi:hypothetical protein